MKNAASGRNERLLFPVGDYTLETIVVPTSAGGKTVAYRSYTHLPYVAHPVDADFQSLDVRVPVEVDGVPVDAAEAPIMFTNAIGGFMSSDNSLGDLRGPRGEGTVGSRHAELALTKGYVVVWPGARGRDNRASDGTYYGKAPAGIVDLKAAVRYIRHNRGVLPGDVERIVSTGCSAGGGMSALLGASGNSPLYDKYLEAIGAADEPDSIFAASCYSPIIDLEHGDMAYEWMYGPSMHNQSGQPVDQALSTKLKSLFAEYQAALGLKGRDGFGPLTADNYGGYLLRYYLVPSATEFLRGLTDGERDKYLASHEWIGWDGSSAAFSFEEYQRHCGRWKGVPSFDTLDMQFGEPSLFGNETTDARHFTEFSLREATGDPQATVDPEVKMLADLMNPMYFALQGNPGCAPHWWLRRGTGETGISLTAMVNLAMGLEQAGRDVNARVFWDAAHCIDEEAERFIDWVGQIAGA